MGSSITLFCILKNITQQNYVCTVYTPSFSKSSIFLIKESLDTPWEFLWFWIPFNITIDQNQKVLKQWKNNANNCLTWLNWHYLVWLNIPALFSNGPNKASKGMIFASFKFTGTLFTSFKRKELGSPASS